MTEKNSSVRARDVDVNYYAVCGILFMLGLALLLFMVVVCFMAKQPGSTQMLVLLDMLQGIPMLGLLICYLRMAAICRRKMKYTRAAVDRRTNGTARVEFAVNQVRYYLDLGKGEKAASAGMINIWYDPANPKHVFFGSKAPQKASPYGIANLGVLLVLSGIVNGIFFLFLR